MDRDALNAQQEHWDSTFTENEEMFGDEPSWPARKALDLLKREGNIRILELGAGQGRDALFFAQKGSIVTASDYSPHGLKEIEDKAKVRGLSKSISTAIHDVREALPFEDASFDACYSHMLFCMAMTTSELEFLMEEIRRVLKPGGLNIYTVRHTGDVHYGKGIHRGEDMYEMNGFIVHFFNRDKVKHLAKGFRIECIEEFEEGPLPRKLFMVTLRKNGG